MNKFSAVSTGIGLSFGSDYNKVRLLKDLKENKGARYKVIRETPESREVRGFYHGAVIPLWVFLDGNDYRDSAICAHYHNEAKKEFNGDIIIRAGKKEKIGKSTKGKLNSGYVDRVIDSLEEQYGIDRSKVLDTELYKKWRDEIYPYGGADNFIQYMSEIGLL